MKFATSVFTFALILVFTKTVHAFIEVTPFHLIVLIKAAVFLIIYNGELAVPPSYSEQPTLPPPVRKTLRIEGTTLQVANSSADLSLVVPAELSAPSPIVVTPSAPVMSLASPAQSSSQTFDLPTPPSLSTILSSLQLIFKLFSPPILYKIVSSLHSISKFLSPSVLFGFMPSLPLSRVFSVVKELLPLKQDESCPVCLPISVSPATSPWSFILAGLVFYAIVLRSHLVKKGAAGAAFIKQEQFSSSKLPVCEDDNDAGDYLFDCSDFENVRLDCDPQEEPFVAADIVKLMEDAAAKVLYPEVTPTATIASEARTLNPRTGTGHPSLGTSNSRPVAGSSAVAATGPRTLDPGAGTGRTSLETPRFRPVGGSSADTASVARTLNPGAGTGPTRPGTSNSRTDGGSIAAPENGKGSSWQDPQTLAEIRIAIRTANDWM
ncbi:hypothetical protein DIURU_000895 [Diutina rugosa]|uniref:Uncharacterized protein n=1 Tax=Diutina rugosa TaxID=5481 RepID=A0A642UWE5_DIURU|nr:uncharacterized protein DIURU_000895 [Diutina rugosa]KAA8906831.1 hypothetical protein DIURU_000895 [Diutina rugosa]